MSEVQTDVIDLSAFRKRQENGLYEPIADTQIEHIYCGDDREPTQPYQMSHGEMVPGRYFGGASGLAVATLTSLVMMHGEAPVRRILRDYGVNAFVDLAADIAHGAYSSQGTSVHQHSAEGAEDHPENLAHPEHPNELGCKFNAALGAVMFIGSDVKIIGDQLDEVHELTGTFQDRRDSQIAQESIGVVMDLLGGSDVAVQRGHLAHVMSRGNRHTPFVMLAGHHANPHETSVVLDMAGYKAKPTNDDPTYHHTPAIAAKLLPESLPEFRFDERCLRASGIVIGLATQRGLGVPKMHVIPQEFATAVA